jgi:gamma-glutamyltranspeptidase/glutathione hydrolase
VPDPNLPAGHKRPRSSMAPTIVARKGRPWLAVGSPGGSTIITTVLQILVNRIDFGMDLPAAIAAPRASQRDASQTDVEPAFFDRWAAELQARFGQSMKIPTSTVTGQPDPEIGNATGIEIRKSGRLIAAAEPVRRGGGDAQVVRQRP